MRGCVVYLKDLDNIYVKATTPLKKIMVGSILEEKLVYGEIGFRIPKYTPVVEYITLKSNELYEIKSGMFKIFFGHSGWVAQSIRISNQFINDLKRLAVLAPPSGTPVRTTD